MKIGVNPAMNDPAAIEAALDAAFASMGIPVGRQVPGVFDSPNKARAARRLAAIKFAAANGMTRRQAAEFADTHYNNVVRIALLHDVKFRREPRK